MVVMFILISLDLNRQSTTKFVIKCVITAAAFLVTLVISGYRIILSLLKQFIKVKLLLFSGFCHNPKH